MLLFYFFYIVFTLKITSIKFSLSIFLKGQGFKSFTNNKLLIRMLDTSLTLKNSMKKINLIEFDGRILFVLSDDRILEGLLFYYHLKISDSKKFIAEMIIVFFFFFEINK